MNKQTIRKTLSSLPLGELQYFESIGSTNDQALVWATEGAPDLSVVMADEQTAGRGRLNRKWITPKASAIAMSLILRQPSHAHLSRIVGLAALSIADACQTRGLAPKIKWPNDILLNEKKVAGILIESVWSGDEMDCLVIGMGVNVAKESTPPADMLQFSATNMEEELGSKVERPEVMYDILSAFIKRRDQIDSDGFLKEWESLLAYKGQRVQITNNSEELYNGTLIGLDKDSALQLLTSDNKIISVQFGDVSLRPAV